jgi:hypothetical protein
MDAKKLASWAENRSANPMAPRMGAGEMEPEDELPGGGGDEGVEPMELAEKYGPLMELLEGEAGEVLDGMSQLDAGALMDFTQPLEGDALSAFQSVMGGLSDEMLTQVRESLPGVSAEDAEALAQHCASEGFTDDPDLLAAFLFRAGEVGAPEGDGGDAPPAEDEGADSDSDFA